MGTMRTRKWSCFVLWNFRLRWKRWKIHEAYLCASHSEPGIRAPKLPNRSRKSLHHTVDERWPSWRSSSRNASTRDRPRCHIRRTRQPATPKIQVDNALCGGGKRDTRIIIEKGLKNVFSSLARYFYQPARSWKMMEKFTCRDDVVVWYENTAALVLREQS